MVAFRPLFIHPSSSILFPCWYDSRLLCIGCLFCILHNSLISFVSAPFPNVLLTIPLNFLVYVVFITPFVSLVSALVSIAFVLHTLLSNLISLFYSSMIFKQSDTTTSLLICLAPLSCPFFSISLHLLLSLPPRENCLNSFNDIISVTNCQFIDTFCY